MEKLIIKLIADQSLIRATAADVKGISGCGRDIDECKKDLTQGLFLMIQEERQHPGCYNLPEWLVTGNYEIEWKADAQSLLTHYTRIINRKAIEQLSGINNKQLCAYASGLHKPRRDKLEKLEKALHKLGNELSAIRLV